MQRRAAACEDRSSAKTVDDLFTIDEAELSIYHIYDSNDPLHIEYNRECAPHLRRLHRETPGLKIRSIDISDLDFTHTERIQVATGKTPAELRHRHRPIFLMKTGNALYKIKTDYLSAKPAKCKEAITRKTSFHEVRTVGELCSALKRYNTKLKDSIVLFYLPEPVGGDK